MTEQQTEQPEQFAIIKRGPLGTSERGPVHQVVPGGAWGQAWCGIRRQFRHRTIRGEFPVTCPRCLKALERGRPYARGSR